MEASSPTTLPSLESFSPIDGALLGSVPGPNRDKADVCGASWSQTVRDP